MSIVLISRTSKKGLCETLVGGSNDQFWKFLENAKLHIILVLMRSSSFGKVCDGTFLECFEAQSIDLPRIDRDSTGGSLPATVAADLASSARTVVTSTEWTRFPDRILVCVPSGPPSSPLPRLRSHLEYIHFSN